MSQDGSAGYLGMHVGGTCNNKHFISIRSLSRSNRNATTVYESQLGLGYRLPSTRRYFNYLARYVYPYLGYLGINERAACLEVGSRRYLTLFACVVRIG